MCVIYETTGDCDLDFVDEDDDDDRWDAFWFPPVPKYRFSPRPPPMDA